MALKSRPKVRLAALFTTFAVATAGIATRLVWMQIVASGKFNALAADQRQRKILLPSQRGSIYDRNGSELAISMEMKTVFANPRFIADKVAAAGQIAGALGVERAQIEQKLQTDKGFVYLARKVEPEVAAKVTALGLPGVDVMPEPKRFYPSGSLASHVVGFVGSDSEGLGGLEDRYDEILRGVPGETLLERDPQGRTIPAGEGRTVPPVAGEDLILTIDKQIQYAAESALAKAVQSYSAKGGTIVVMRPDNGDILALANFPTFDPNDFRAAAPEARKNRALVDVYEPGSANKVITAAAVLEEGVVKPSDRMKVPDNMKLASKVFRDAHPHPVLDLSFAEVIQQSSNIGTIKVALGLGRTRLYEYLFRFGYGRPTGLDFPGEAAGILPKPDRWWDTSMGTIPIGQGVAVTPMQIMSVFATMANDGVAVQPRLLAAKVDAQGRREASPRSSSRRVVKPATAQAVTKILVGVTEGKDGTGTMAAIDGYQVAGKTGTAQKPLPGGGGYGGYVGSFIGYAPAGAPKLVVGVILDEPSPIWGGVTAAPTFKEVMGFSLRYLGIGPGPVLPSEGTPLPAPGRSGGTAPSVAPDVSRPAPATDGTAD